MTDRSSAARANAPLPLPPTPTPAKHPAFAEARPKIGVADANSGLRLLLDIEAEARRATTLQELYFVIANETRKLTRARQIFVFANKGHLRLAAISGLPNFDPQAPFVHDIQQALNEVGRQQGHMKRHAWSLADNPSATNAAGYPFPHLFWVPFLSRQQHLLGGMLLVREQPWAEADMPVAERLAETFQHALAPLTATSRIGLASWGGLRGFRGIVGAAVLAGLAAMFIPVQMSVLSPMEIKPLQPTLIAAPIEGVIEEVLVEPGAAVAPQQPVVRFSDTVLRNRLEVAEREVEVAKAQLKKASQQAFNDEDGRRALRSAMADLALKNAELSFAREMLDRATIRAERAGIAVFSDKQGLVGKPVALGERIMQIADPQQIEVEIELAVEDALVLQPGAPVRVFLDSDPVHPRSGRVKFSDYQAHQLAAGDRLAFRVVAGLDPSDASLPRIGVRGTAQIYGEDTRLGFYLFRRPLSALRQWIGL